MAWWDKVIDWIRLPARYLVPIAALSGFLVFASAKVLDRFGLTAFVQLGRPWIALVFLASLAVLVSLFVWEVGRWAKKRFDISQKANRRIVRLGKLTPDEKHILLGYLVKNTKTQYFAITDGVVSGLVSAEIIYQSSANGQPDSWAYNIQPWAWEYLKQHRGMVLSDEEVNELEQAEIDPEAESRQRGGFPW